jgi:hypothetical protein
MRTFDHSRKGDPLYLFTYASSLNMEGVKGKINTVYGINVDTLTTPEEVGRTINQLYNDGENVSELFDVPVTRQRAVVSSESARGDGGYPNPNDPSWYEGQDEANGFWDSTVGQILGTVVGLGSTYLNAFTGGGANMGPQPSPSGQPHYQPPSDERWYQNTTTLVLIVGGVLTVMFLIFAMTQIARR